MEELSSNFSFTYIDKNPKMKFIGYIDIRSDNSANTFFEEDITDMEKVA